MPAPLEPAALAAALLDPGGAADARLAFAHLDVAAAVQCLHALVNMDTAAARAAALDALAAHPAPQSELFRPFWKRIAEDTDVWLRDAALDRAGQLEPPHAAVLLVLWLADPDASLRRRALTRILILNQPAPEAAQRGLADADPAVRAQAIRLAARFPDPVCIEGLFANLRGAETRLQAESLKALPRHHDLLGLAAAAWAAEHADGEAAQAGAGEMRRLGAQRIHTSIVSACAGYPRDWPAPDPPALLELLLRAGARPRDELVRWAAAEPAGPKAGSEPPLWLRRALVAAEAVQPAGNAGAIRRLQRLTHDPDPDLRAEAVAALERHDAADPGAVLATLLNHSQADVRRQALEALGRAGTRALRWVRRFLDDADPDLRRAACAALAELLPEDAARLWSRATADADPALRALAAARLVELPESLDAGRALVRAARHEDPAVRIAALRALLAREIVLPGLAAAYKRTLEDLLVAGFQPGGRQAARSRALLDWEAAELAALVEALAASAPPGYIECLVAAARHPSAVVRRAAAEALRCASAQSPRARQGLAMLAGTDDPDVLRRVVEVLAEAKDPRGLVPLVRALDECGGQREKLEPFLKRYPEHKSLRFLLGALRQPFASVKRFALRGLKELDSPEMIEPLLLASRDPDPDVQRGALQALAKFAKHPAVYERLLQLRDAGGDEHLRQEAVATLLGMDSPAVVEPLLEATRDKDYEVQCGAVVALGKFAARPEVLERLLEMIEYGDVSVRETVVRTLGEHKIREAVPALVRLVANPFLCHRVGEALLNIGDRQGLLALKRYKIRQRVYGKKGKKGPLPSLGRRGPARRAGPR
ncbi:MAG: HEAT repeat domain-containing protein [Planctomycetes bacterium]|nr:HEAT repeat domain-containing protein [Planctomycetota bacterium]